MRVWEAASVAFFVYLLVITPRARAAGGRRIARIAAGSAAGLLLTMFAVRAPASVLWHDWVAPPLLLLTGYWVSGLLFVAPRASQERALMALDIRLRILPLAHRMPAFLAEFLELAYVGVYPLIPIALGLHLLFTPDASAERFWNVILTIDYVCFGALTWIQTRPPRALERDEPWRSRIRLFNLRLVGAASVGVNTFPSGHAAEALAAALLVVGAPWPVVAWMAACALAVSAGAVFGRYHYAADAVAGWAVALAVWTILG